MRLIVNSTGANCGIGECLTPRQWCTLGNNWGYKLCWDDSQEGSQQNVFLMQIGLAGGISYISQLHKFFSEYRPASETGSRSCCGPPSLTQGAIMCNVCNGVIVPDFLRSSSSGAICRLPRQHRLATRYRTVRFKVLYCALKSNTALSTT